MASQGAAASISIKTWRNAGAVCQPVSTADQLKAWPSLRTWLRRTPTSSAAMLMEMFMRRECEARPSIA